MEPADEGLPLVPGGVPLSVDDADGSATEIGSRSGREARLDLLLAEELAVDRTFDVWFLREAGEWRRRPDLPDGPPDQANVRMNLFEDASPIPPDAYGETIQCETNEADMWIGAIDRGADHAKVFS